MSIPIAKFTENGMREFEEFVMDARNKDWPKEKLIQEQHRLLGKRYCRVYSVDIEINPAHPDLKTRYDLAQQLHPKLHALGIPLGFSKDLSPLWAWLSLAYFHRLTNAGGRGYKVLANAAYVPDSSTLRWYRHLVAMAVMAYEWYGERSKMLLSSKVGSHAEVVEQLQSKSYVLGATGVVEAAYRIFWDSAAGKLKPGVAIRSKTRPGFRSFNRRLQQLQFTYDLYQLSADELIGMVPEQVEAFGLDN